MSDDSELLRRYALERSEAAFGELVQEHLGFVYQTALRQLNGDSHGAKDVAQGVFVALAAQAKALSARELIVGWLHVTTRNIASQWLRTERRRRAREAEAHLMQEITREISPTVDWDQVRPLIEESLDTLDPTDREAVLLRYFEGRDYAAIGARLRLTADGARSRVDRALDKMQPLLHRRGLTSTAAALGAALSTQAAPFAPAGLAAAITSAVLGGGLAASTGTAVIAGIQIMKISTILLAGSLAANVVLGVVYVRDAVPAAQALTPPINQPALPTAHAAALQSVYSPDPKVFLSRLTAATVPEGVRRALIEAAIDEQFRAREEALLPKRPAVGWWQWQDTKLPIKTSLALLDLNREKAKLRVQLLGPDPAEIAADAGSPIAPEKRELVKLITEDYSTMLAAIPRGPFRTPAETAQFGELEKQRQKDLADLLTPAELAAYDERTWDQLPYLKGQLRGFQPTPDEFAVLRAALIARNKPGADSGVYRDTMEQENDQILKAIGPERFDELYLSKSGSWFAVASLVERTGLPRANLLSAFAVWKNAEAESHAINARQDIGTNEKIAAIKELGAKSRTGILNTLGPEAGPAYIRAEGDAWLGTLDRGQGVTFSTGGIENFYVGESRPIRTSVFLENRR